MRLINLEKYCNSQPLFSQTGLPYSCNSDLDNDRVVEVNRYLKSNVVRYIYEKCNSYPIYLRFDPYTLYDEVPRNIVGEAPIRPINPDWLEKLTIYKNKKPEGCCYVWTDNKFPDDYPKWEKENRGVVKLEVSIERNNKGNLKISAEELARDSGFQTNGGVGRFIHLDTNDPVGSEFSKSVLNHLDLSIYFYDEIGFSQRCSKFLYNDDVDKVINKVHLYRTENIPFSRFFEFAWYYFESTTLVEEWFDNQFAKAPHLRPNLVSIERWAVV